jgi:hypothetical protein
VLTYIRRLIKSPSNAQITDNLLIDYVNRFWILDVDARIQLFDLKCKYQFQTQPGVDQYNTPLYNLQVEPGGSTISYYPVYQGFLDPVYINGIQVPMQVEKTSFFNIWPNVVQQMYFIGCGDGVTTNFTFTFPVTPNNEPEGQPFQFGPPFQYFLRGHTDTNGIIVASNFIGSYIDPIFGTTLLNNAGVMVVPSTSIYSAVYITSVDANGNSLVVQDSGQFLQSGGSNMPNYGLLMYPGAAPFGYSPPANGYETSFVITGITQADQAVLTVTSAFAIGQEVIIEGVVGMTQLNGNTYTVVANGGTTLTLNVNSTAFTAYVSGGVVSSFANYINYFTGVGNVTFQTPPAAGAAISAQAFLFQCGLPRGVLFNNNTLTFRSPPDRQYLVEIDAYLTPAGFLSTTAAIPFAYMSEYIARGAARKILSDTGDWEQFDRYEPLFLEQEILVWKRSQRQFTSERTQTIYSQGLNQGEQGSNSLGGQTN